MPSLHQDTQSEPKNHSLSTRGFLAVSKSFLLSPLWPKTTSAFLEGVTSSSVSHDKNKSLTASIKNVFLRVGIGNICRNELEVAAPGLSGSFSNWEARHVCLGLRFLLLFDFQCGCCCCDLSVTDWSITHPGKEKKKGVPHLNYSKINVKKTHSSCVMQRHILLSNFLSLTLTQFISWRPCERPKWKTLLLLSNV